MIPLLAIAGWGLAMLLAFLLWKLSRIVRGAFDGLGLR